MKQRRPLAPDHAAVKQYRAPIAQRDYAFDDEQRPVAITHPVYDDDDEQPTEQDRREIARGIKQVLAWLMAGADPAQTWRRLQILGLLFHRAGITLDGAPHSQAELARRLHVTPGRCSQLLADTSGFAGIFEQKTDSAKLQSHL